MYDSDTTYMLWVNLNERNALFYFLYRGTNGSSPLIEAQYAPFACILYSHLGNSLEFLLWALLLFIHTLKQFIMEQLTLFPHIPETQSDESIHALQEQREALDEWLIDLINDIEPEFWWIY